MLAVTYVALLFKFTQFDFQNFNFRPSIRLSQNTPSIRNCFVFVLGMMGFLSFLFQLFFELQVKGDCVCVF